MQIKTITATVAKAFPIDSKFLKPEYVFPIGAGVVLTAEEKGNNNHYWIPNLAKWVFKGHTVLLTPPIPVAPPATTLNYLKVAANFIAVWEGYRSKAYLCSAGVATIGFGTTRINGQPVRLGMTCTKEQALGWFVTQLKGYAAPIVSMPNFNSLTDNQRAALISLSYNIGTGGFSKSTLRRKVIANPRDRAGISAAFLSWNKAGGRVIQGLVNRRNAEIKLFFS